MLGYPVVAHSLRGTLREIGFKWQTLQNERTNTVERARIVGRFC